MRSSNLGVLAMVPSENWNQENMRKYEFISIKRRWSEDLQCKSEKVMQLQRTSDNSEL